VSKHYLGLDVSPLRIGWAVVEAEDDDAAVLDHGVIIFDSKAWVTPGMRSERLEDLADKHANIDMVGLEAVFVGPNKLGSIRAAMALGQVESIVDYLWPEVDQKILVATQWRAACGIAQGGKQGVMDWSVSACRAYGVHPPENQDAADATAIAWATMVRDDG